MPLKQKDAENADTQKYTMQKSSKEDLSLKNVPSTNANAQDFGKIKED